MSVFLSYIHQREKKKKKRSLEWFPMILITCFSVLILWITAYCLQMSFISFDEQTRKSVVLNPRLSLSQSLCCVSWMIFDGWRFSWVITYFTYFYPQRNIFNVLIKSGIFMRHQFIKMVMRYNNLPLLTKVVFFTPSWLIFQIHGLCQIALGHGNVWADTRCTAGMWGCQWEGGRGTFFPFLNSKSLQQN